MLIFNLDPSQVRHIFNKFLNFLVDVEYNSAYQNQFEKWEQKNAEDRLGQNFARKTNLKIGHDIKKYQDSQKSVYSNFYDYKKGEVSKLDESHLRDLRSHHFKLGHMKYGPDMQASKTEQSSVY